MNNRPWIGLSVFFALLLCPESSMHGFSPWQAYKRVARAPFVFAGRFVKSFKQEVSGEQGDVDEIAEKAGTGIGSRLGKSVMGIPERMINASVDQLCVLALSGIQWGTLYGMARGYITFPASTIPGHYKKGVVVTLASLMAGSGIYFYYTSPQEEQLEQKQGIKQEVTIKKETDAEFVDRISLPERDKALLRQRFETALVMGGSSREKGSLAVIKTLPWDTYTNDTHDLAQAKKILDESHYGLKRLKEHILNYIAVHTLNKGANPPVLCLVGPPGTGKTSIAKTIARCLGRNYDLIACGNITEKSRLVGISPSYVGAHEGLFIKVLKKTESMNPVIILDEVDKMSEQPMDCLLAFLDPQQNSTFRDHFIDIPCDFSKTLNILTVNSIEHLSPALRDRMHIITIPPFGNHEKLAIAQKFLVDKAIRYAGLHQYKVELEAQLNDSVLNHIIKHYTNEPGVRDLERTLKTLCSEIARKFIETKQLPKITVENLSLFIDKPPVSSVSKSNGI